MIIVNFEYQKEKARKIKKRVERLQEWVKSLDSYLIEYQEYKGDKKHKASQCSFETQKREKRRFGYEEEKSKY